MLTVTSRSFLLRMRNVSDKSCRENQNTHFVSRKLIPGNRVLWENVEKYGKARRATDENRIRRMRSACRITKATDKLRMCNTYRFSAASVVAQTCLCVDVYIHVACLLRIFLILLLYVVCLSLFCHCLNLFCLILLYPLLLSPLLNLYMFDCRVGFWQNLQIGIMCILCSDVLQCWLSLLCMSLQSGTSLFFFFSTFVRTAYVCQFLGNVFSTVSVVLVSHVDFLYFFLPPVSYTTTVYENWDR
jgi:hypothetical protein